MVLITRNNLPLKSSIFNNMSYSVTVLLYAVAAHWLHNDRSLRWCGQLQFFFGSSQFSEAPNYDIVLYWYGSFMGALRFASIGGVELPFFHPDESVAARAT